MDSTSREERHGSLPIERCTLGGRTSRRWPQGRAPVFGRRSFPSISPGTLSVEIEKATLEFSRSFSKTVGLLGEEFLHRLVDPRSAGWGTHTVGHRAHPVVLQYLKCAFNHVNVRYHWLQHLSFSVNVGLCSLWRTRESYTQEPVNGVSIYRFLTLYLKIDNIIIVFSR